MRRLYDIANVLQSIGLIEKCKAQSTNKPSFEWVGLERTRECIEELKRANQNRKPSDINLKGGAV